MTSITLSENDFKRVINAAFELHRLEECTGECVIKSDIDNTRLKIERNDDGTFDISIKE